MTEDSRWQRVRALFAEANALPAARRDAFLRDQCGDDEALYDEIVVLLEHTDQSDDAISDIVRDAAKAMVKPEPNARLDERVGNYRLIRVIGTGGMGSVYLAERVDEQFEHRVAIKILHPHRRDPSLVARFRAERQLLANLDHPNIARLLDGGETEEGVPYFVMEYVDGLPIDSFCDERRLSVAERLRLFQKICSAANYAHRNLVVHRDIKPSNILVGTDGEPKLLDFGIAKILDESALHYTVAVTREGVSAMTPEFASPEQVRGESISTATDIYSMGVLLYRMLCGHTPYQPKNELAIELARAIVEDKPSPPSTALTLDQEAGGQTQDAISAARGTSVVRLRNRLQGDLDNIVLMTLRKEPERRYVSALALSEDIEHYLAHRPISARPDSLVYRSSKFVRRNRVGVAATLVMAGLLSSAAMQVVQQRDRAAIAAAQSDEVVAFLSDLFEGASPAVAQGDEMTAANLLEAGVREVDSLSEQPAVQARLYDIMGESYNWIGDFERALALTLQSLALREERLPYDPDAIANTLRNIGENYRLIGDLEQAEQLMLRSAALYREAHGENDANVAFVLGRLGEIYRMQRHPEVAVDTLQQGVDIMRNLGREKDSEGIDIRGNLAIALDDAGRITEAEIIQRVVVADSRVVDGPKHPNTTIRIANLGLMQMRMGQFDVASRNIAERYDLVNEIWSSDPQQLIRAALTQGTILSDLGRFSAALEYYEEGLALALEHFGREHFRYAAALRVMGAWHVETAEFAAAESLLQDSLDILSAAGRDRSSEAARARYWLASAKLGLQKLAEGEAISRDALTQPDTMSVAVLTQQKRVLAEILGAQGRADEAVQLFAEAISEREALRGPENVGLIYFLTPAARQFRRTGDVQQALALAQRAYALSGVISPANNWRAAITVAEYAQSLAADGQLEAAKPLIETSLADLQAIFGNEDPRVISLRTAASSN